MKKVMVFLLLLSLTACGNANTANVTNTANTVSTTNAATTTASTTETINAAPEPNALSWDGVIKDVNPEDYFVSEHEYDLVGFMENFGFESLGSDPEHGMAWFWRESDKQNMAIMCSADGYDPDYVAISVLKQGSPTYYGLDYLKNGNGGDTYLTGDMSDLPPFNGANLIRALREMPAICRNIEEGHCPFHNTNIVRHYQNKDPETIRDDLGIHHFSGIPTFSEGDSGMVQDSSVCH